MKSLIITQCTSQVYAGFIHPNIPVVDIQEGALHVNFARFGSYKVTQLLMMGCEDGAMVILVGA